MSGGAGGNPFPTNNLQGMVGKKVLALSANLPGIDCVILAFLCPKFLGI